MAFLRKLTETAIVGDITIAHGSPRNPIWEYVLDIKTALVNFGAFDTQICFIGHSHLPLAFLMDPSGKSITWKLLSEMDVITIDGRAMINPGSVGQPRDHDPLSAFGIFDSEAQTWQARRVEYDIAAVQKRIRAANLPKRHADRLADGW